MNKNAIQKFAVWARKEMIAQVSQRAYQYGITKESYGEENAVTIAGRALTNDEQRQRAELVQQIKTKGYDQVMEEVAYTWFNRFIALRYMEVNNYLPSHIRVFSDANGAFKPEILADVLHLELDGLDKEKVAAYIDGNQTDDLYRYLLLTQCNALNSALPGMFERLGSYTELLLPNNILKGDGILGRLVTDIPEEDWHDQVQIIGWLYQYYNEEFKEETYALLKKNVKVTKERIPSATQLFTPDRIVRYMVENSLGRLVISGQCAADSEAERIEKEKAFAEKMGWKYYLPEAEQELDVRAQIQKLSTDPQSLTTIKVIDPCMGSGHILVYAFDVLIQIYEASGISQRDAAQQILKNNLYGLDIDDRAAQLAYFAVMMKARQYDRRIFTRGIQPHLYALQNSQPMHEEGWAYFGPEEPLAFRLWQAFTDAKTLGSLVPVDLTLDELTKLRNRLADMDAASTMGSLSVQAYVGQILDTFAPLIELAEILTQKYDVVITNPPYMGSSNMDKSLSDFVKKQYPDSRSDLFSCFIEKGNDILSKNGLNCMVTMQSWMFLSSFEKMRTRILQNYDITNLMHMDNMVLGIAFGTAVTIFKNSHIVGYKGTYNHIKLQDIEDDRPSEFPVEGNRFAQVSTSNFSKIPGSPVAYWVSDAMLEPYSKKFKLLGDMVSLCAGLATGDNTIFQRYWYEVSIENIGFNVKDANETIKMKEKWFPCNSGGNFRKWSTNDEIVVNWKDNGKEIRQFRNTAGKLAARPQNIKYYFKEGLTWNKLSSSNFGVKYKRTGFIFDDTSRSAFLTEKRELLPLIGLLCSNVAFEYLKALNPTMSFTNGDLIRIPIKIDGNMTDIQKFVENNVVVSKNDWDSFETSWDFQQDPLVRNSTWLWDATVVGATMNAYYDGVRQSFHSPMEMAYLLWKGECNHRFRELKKNEEELNRIFIDIYGLQDELTPDVADKDVTVYCIYDIKEDVPETLSGSNYVLIKRDVIVNFISYAVGCMFGRYSLYNDGLLYAGGGSGDFGSLVEKIQDHLRAQGKTYFPENEFYPDPDNLIPICDDEYFDDDITGRFVKFVETVFGADSLEENLTFIADALGGKGTAREIIRNYFLKEFYKDHCKTYKKRPIYWLFDSGKKNGFKALIYMHRYQPDLLARMRTDYVHEQQERYRIQLAHIDDILPQATGSERVKLTKQQKKLQDQSLEIQQYEEKIHHLADQNIAIDLDDGVKHNYALFADVLAKIK